MSRLKILHVTPNGNIGGRERQVYLLMKELSGCRDQVENDLFFIEPVGPFYEKSLTIPIRIYSVDVQSYDPRYLIRVFKIFKTYDIINFWGINVNLFLLSLLHSNIKIFTLTGPRLSFKKTLYEALGGLMGPKGLTKKGSIINSNYKKAASIIMTGVDGILRIVRKQAFISFLKKCNLVITPSYYMKDMAIKNYEALPDKVTVIPNFINYEDVTVTKEKREIRSELHIRPSTKLIGVVARFDARKRLDRIVNAMTLVPEDQDIVAVILGDGNEQERQKLTLEIKNAKMEQRIFLPGFRADIYNYINAFDLFVLPSDKEGFGMVLLEALCLRIPAVIFNDCGGGLEIIKHQKTGIVVHSEAELANIIQSSFNSSGDFESMVDNGYRYVTSHFGRANAALYRDLFVRFSLN